MKPGIDAPRPDNYNLGEMSPQQRQMFANLTADTPEADRRRQNMRLLANHFGRLTQANPTLLDEQTITQLKGFQAAINTMLGVYDERTQSMVKSPSSALQIWSLR